MPKLDGKYLGLGLEVELTSSHVMVMKTEINGISKNEFIRNIS